MSKYTPTGNVSTKAQFDSEFEKIKVAIDSQLDRDTSTSNALSVNLDVNSKRILNVPDPVHPTDVVRVKDISSISDGVSTNVGSLGLVSSVVGVAEQTIFSVAERALFVVQADGYVALQGDIVTASGLIAELQPSDDSKWNVLWFGADSSGTDQHTFFNLAALRALAYISDTASGINTRAIVVVPKGDWALGQAIATEAIWEITAGAEFTQPHPNYANNNQDNLSYLTGKVIRVGARGGNLLQVGASDLQWIQDIRDTILGTHQVQIISDTGKGGVLAATRTSDKAAASQGTIGFVAYVVNDDEASKGVAYGMYKESIRYPGAGSTFCEESNVTTYGTFVPITPNNVIGDEAGVTVNYWIGGPVADGPLEGVETEDPTSAGIVFAPGGASAGGLKRGFDAGIIFLNVSFETSAQKEVLRMGNDMQFAWYGDGGVRTSGQRGSTESDDGVQRIYVRRGSDARLTNYTYTPSSFSADDLEVNLGSATRCWIGTYTETVHLGTTNTPWTTGTGDPEGVVTAPIGSMFTRSDGGVGTTLYVKEADNGLNTGWAAK